jgi:putative NADPH-quinone reductase
VRLQHELIEQLLAADVLLIGIPMYTCSMPSTLKAWTDHIHVAGLTAPRRGHPAQPMPGSRAGHQPRRRVRLWIADRRLGSRHSTPVT